MNGSPPARNPLGRTGLQVSPICIGTSPLASMPSLYGYEVDEDRALATLAAVLRGPFNFLDTSNNYGGGSAERRIGRALAAAGGVPDGFVVATKVDADPQTGDFSGDRVKRSAEESLTRLGLGHVPLMYLHDPEFHLSFEAAMAPGGPVRALAGLRDQGVLGHLGVAGGAVPLMTRFAATGVFDVVLSHNRFTLVDRSAEPLMAAAGEHGAAFVNGAPYGGGILSKGPEQQPRYAYRPASAATLAAVLAMRDACAGHCVPLAAAALQFSVRDPRVTSTVLGVSQPARVAGIEALLRYDIPGELWSRLDELCVPAEHWLH